MHLATEMESEIVPVRCSGWREVPGSHPLDTSERSHNLLPFCSELGGLFVWWGLCAAFSSAGVK